MIRIVTLEHRAVLRVGGPDRIAFLQGLISNDATRIAADRMIHAALLTAQGRFLHDLFLVGHGDEVWIDAERERLEDLRRRLAIYRLRSKVTLELAPDRVVEALWPAGEWAGSSTGDPEEWPASPGGACADGGAILARDPRLAALGWRRITTGPAAMAVDATPAPLADWDSHRLMLGVPDGSRDLEPERALLLESGFDELNGIDWAKGCYVGQELTARTKYRGLVKKRLLPVVVEGALPPAGAPVLRDGVEAGEFRGGVGDRGLALLRLDALGEGPALVATGVTLRPILPDWVRLPATAD
jgi:hypothetical protein